MKLYIVPLVAACLCLALAPISAQRGTHAQEVGFDFAAGSIGGDSIWSLPGRAEVSGTIDMRSINGSVVQVDDSPIVGSPRTLTGDTTQTATTTWASGGKTIVVSTPRKAGEALDNWVRRHADAVQAFQNVFDVDPPSGG